MESQEHYVNFSEQDVKRVVAELDASPEAPKEAVNQEAVRSALVAALPKPAIVAPATPVAATGSDSPVAQARIDELVHMAVAEGIDAAHAAALADEPYVLDALHDALAGALYDQLQREGKL